jgi:protein MpaA
MTAVLFEPAPFVRQIEEAARAGGWTIHYLSPTPSSPRPWLQRAARAGQSSTGHAAPRFYLSAGIHGDEVAGPLAVLEMLRLPDFFDRVDMTIFPILNPEGLARAVRGNVAGVDLNRDYKNAKSEEIRGHLAVLPALGRFAAAMMLHEDFEGTGAYLYELNEGPVGDLGPRIIAAMRGHVPIDERPVIEEVTATGGILQRADLVRLLGPIEERLEWPEAIYLSVNHTRVSYTTETPMLQPIGNRVAAQIAAVRTVVGSLEREPAREADSMRTATGRFT